MKKILLIIIMFIITSCNYTEINELEIITSMILDYKDNNYILTSQIVNSDNIINIYNTSGKTIDECIYKLSSLSNKKVFLSHLKTLIITEDLIKSNKDYTDYFLRDPKIKMNFNIYFIDDKYKDDVFIINKDKFYIKDITKFNTKDYSSTYELSFLDLVYKKEYKIDIMYPNIIVQDNNIYLKNLVGFNSNYEKVILNNNESIYYNMITNNLNKTDLVIPCKNNNFSITINKSNIKNNTLTITGKMNSYDCIYDLNKSDTMNKLSNITNKEIEKNINNLINKLNNKMNIPINKVTVKSSITSIGELRK